MQNCLTSNDSFNDLVINFFSEHSLNIMVMTERVNKKLFSNFFSFFCQTLYISWQIWTKQIFFFYRMSEILCGRIFGWCPMQGCFERSMCNYSIKNPQNLCLCFQYWAAKLSLCVRDIFHHCWGFCQCVGVTQVLW